jgi:hypothetical protein
MRISKRTGLAIAILGVTVVPFAWAGLAPAKTTAPSSKQVGCGIERWSVKTLADPAGRTLSLSPKATTIRALRNKRVPAISACGAVEESSGRRFACTRSSSR